MAYDASTDYRAMMRNMEIQGYNISIVFVQEKGEATKEG